MGVARPDGIATAPSGAFFLVGHRPVDEVVDGPRFFPGRLASLGLLRRQPSNLPLERNQPVGAQIEGRVQWGPRGSGVRRNTSERVAFHEEAKDDFSVPGTLSVQVGHPVAELLVAGDPIGKWCLHVGLEDPLGFALGRIGNPDRDRARRLVLNPHPILKLIMARLGPGGGGSTARRQTRWDQKKKARRQNERAPHARSPRESRILREGCRAAHPRQRPRPADLSTLPS